MFFIKDFKSEEEAEILFKILQELVSLPTFDDIDNETEDDCCHKQGSCCCDNDCSCGDSSLEIDELKKKVEELEKALDKAKSLCFAQDFEIMLLKLKLKEYND